MWVSQKYEIKRPEQVANEIGVKKHYTIDAKHEFAEEFIFKAIKANAMYEGYPLSTSLARPLIAMKIVELAEMENADAIAHGCTGKGNDQFRFESTIRSGSRCRIIAPVRDLSLTRTEEMDYAKDNNIPVPLTSFTVSTRISGEGLLKEMYSKIPWLKLLKKHLNGQFQRKMHLKKAQYLDITFKNGVPVAIDGKEMGALEIIIDCNRIAGLHGIRKDRYY